MKDKLRQLNIGKIVAAIIAVVLILTTVAFIILSTIKHLGYNLHLLLWTTLSIILLLFYSKIKNEIVSNLSLVFGVISIVGVIIDVCVMFIRFLKLYPYIAVIIIVSYVLLVMVDDWWFDEPPSYYSGR